MEKCPVKIENGYDDVNCYEKDSEKKSVLQEWVQNLGLRFQGVLISATRGCDYLTKEDASKALVRAYRSEILISYDKNPKSFIDKVDDFELAQRMEKLLYSFDHYPLHWIMHMAYAAEILGFYHPIQGRRELWNGFYVRLVKKLHLNPETKEQLDERLSASEEEFIGCYRV